MDMDGIKKALERKRVTLGSGRRYPDHFKNK